MHYLMMVSETPSMMYQAETLVRTIKKFSHNKPVEFTLILQGYDKGPIKLPLPMVKIDKISCEYLQRNVEIVYTPYYWELGAPCRWFVEPRRSMCVFIDVDVVACSDLSLMYELDQDAIHGVKAMIPHLNDEQWDSIGLNKHDREFYFNMGMVIVPSKHIKEIGTKLFEIYPKMQELFPKKSYYAGQISLTYIVKQMGLKRNSLPKKFNWFDMRPYCQMKEKPIFFHYFINRNKHDNEKLALRDNANVDYKRLFDEAVNTNSFTGLVKNEIK